MPLKILILLILSKSSLAIVGSEIPLLVELVSQTTSQLNELERIVSNGEKLTKKMTEYNEVMEDHYFRAERLKIIGEEILLKRKIDNLEDLNYHLRSLKGAMVDTKKILDNYRESLKEEEVQNNKVISYKKIRSLKVRQAKTQIQRSSDLSKNSLSNRLTSQNTALIYESNLNQESELLNINKQLSLQNKMLSENQLIHHKKQSFKEKFFDGLYSKDKINDKKLSSY